MGKPYNFLVLWASKKSSSDLEGNLDAGLISETGALAGGHLGKGWGPGQGL